MECGIFGKIKRTRNIKRARILHDNCKYFFIKINPVHDLDIKLCNELLKFKHLEIVWEICVPVSLYQKITARVEKADILSWTPYIEEFASESSVILSD